MSPTRAQHLTVHPSMKLLGVEGKSTQLGVTCSPPLSCLHPQTASPGQGGQQKLPSVLYLAASTGLGWDELLPSGSLCYTGLWSAGRTAQVPFLPGCLGPPLGLALLHILTTILRL